MNWAHWWILSLAVVMGVNLWGAIAGNWSAFLTFAWCAGSAVLAVRVLAQAREEQDGDAAPREWRQGEGFRDVEGEDPVLEEVGFPLSVRCPSCKAPPGQRCRSVANGWTLEKHHHTGRVLAAKGARSCRGT